MTIQSSLPVLGEVLRDRYRLDAVLGEGGHGRVYRGTELGTGRVVAVKVLKSQEVKLATRFRREARAIAALRCEHTLTLFDYGEHGQNLFMVLEFIDGEDLSDRLRRSGPLEEAELVHLLRQVLSSLKEAHEHGVLHRDIKPANIRLYEYAGDPLRVKVLDFGLAKAIDGDEPSLTRTGAVIGTPKYMSPEQLVGEDLSPASDIFSAGLVALEALVGPAHQLIAHIPNRLTGLQLGDEREVSVELKAIVNRMLARQRADRYASAAAVIHDLHQLAGPKPSAPRPPAMPVTVAAPPATARAAPRPAVELPERSHRWGFVIVAAVLALLFVAFMLYEPAKPLPVPTAPARNVSALLTRAAPTEPAAEHVTPTTLGDCGVPFEGAGYITDGQLMETARWYTYIPPSLDPTGPHPLIILLHQQGHTGEILLDHGGFKEVADEHGVILVAPTAPGFNAWTPHSKNAPKVVYMLEELSAQLCIDPARVFAVGHASGGGIAPFLACRGLVAATATYAFGMSIGHRMCEAETAIPHLSMYPMKSGYEPFEGGTTCSGARRMSARQTEDMWLKRNDCERVSKPSFRDGESTCWRHECAAAVQTCHIDGGHGWTGTPERPFQYRVNDCDGPTPTFPMAAHVWDFFAGVASEPTSP